MGELAEAHPNGLSLPELHHRMKAQKAMRVTLSMLKDALAALQGFGPRVDDYRRAFPLVVCHADIYQLTEDGCFNLNLNADFVTIRIRREAATYLLENNYLYDNDEDLIKVIKEALA